MNPRKTTLILAFLWGWTAAIAQPVEYRRPRTFSLERADSLHHPRLWVGAGVAAVGYPTGMSMLWNSWYAKYPFQRFHFFNDLEEWQQMDKMGHIYSAYQETRLGYHLGYWAGMKPKSAIWTGIALGQLVQTSFEIFDGFSSEWGFSLGDIGANVTGSALFAIQQHTWREQRITLKMSTKIPRYPDVLVYPSQGNGPPVSLQDRADDLYGTGLASLLLKNYNAQAMWVSVNPRSFAPQSTWLPRWLNVSVGMGADNMFSGFGYAWQPDKSCTGPDCLVYTVDAGQFPRTRQWFCSLDVDLTRIPVKNRTLKTVLATLNMFKIPAPTLEWSRQRGLSGYWMYF